MTVIALNRTTISEFDLADLTKYLGCVAAEIRVNGWVSGREADELGGLSTAVATAENIAKLLTDPADTSVPRPDAADRALVADALAWVRSLRSDDLNDYMLKLQTVCSRNTLQPKGRGVATSLISAYQRHLERQQSRRAVEALLSTSTFQGTVGKRQEWTLTLVGKKTTQSTYGLTTIVRLTDGQNAFTWFATGNFDMAVGQTYRVKATVKDHEEYRPRDAQPGDAGVKTTYLNRLTVIAPVDPANA